MVTLTEMVTVMFKDTVTVGQYWQCLGIANNCAGLAVIVLINTNKEK